MRDADEESTMTLLALVLLGGIVLGSVWLGRLVRDRQRLNAPTLADDYRALWARPVVIDGEERLPVARRLE